jgi:serine/threonine protein kinase
MDTCQCMTLKGIQCKNKAKPGSKFCQVHKSCNRPMEAKTVGSGTAAAKTRLSSTSTASAPAPSAPAPAPSAPTLPTHAPAPSAPHKSFKSAKTSRKTNGSGLQLSKYESLPTLESMKYKIGKKLGQGQYGSVFKAIDSEGKPVAIKFIDPAESNEADLAQEVGLLTELSKDGCQKNIVCYYGIYRTVMHGKPTLAIVMEYINGQDMDKVFDKVHKPLSRKIARHFVSGLLNGLKIMHDRHIFHGDIKEGNIMMMKGAEGDGDLKSGDPIYVDFGLGCKSDLPEKGPYSCDRGFGGSEYYMSKGRVECYNTKQCTEKEHRYGDIWALGIVLLNVLSGIQPPTNDEDKDNVLLYKWLANYIRKNGNELCQNDKNINEMLKLALSNNTDITVDDLIAVFNKQ